MSVCRQQSEEGEKNGSEDDDEEKPGKRVMGPRKKFIWDDKLRSVSLLIFRTCIDIELPMIVIVVLVCVFSRSLLCNLVRVKLSCYELEGKISLSVEDYLKAFMETEVKPLWPKGWMQARWVSDCTDSLFFNRSFNSHVCTNTTCFRLRCTY